jgi:hypothetical protein
MVAGAAQDLHPGVPGSRSRACRSPVCPRKGERASVRPYPRRSAARRRRLIKISPTG